jgi:hypothetical protein
VITRNYYPSPATTRVPHDSGTGHSRMKQTTLFGHYARSASTPAKTQKSPKRKRRASPQRESSESPSSSRTQGRARARREPESGSDDDLCKSRLQPAADVIDVEERSPTPPSPKKRRLRRAHSEDSGEEAVATENDEREGDMIAFRVQRKGSGWRTKSLVLDSDDDGKPKKGKLVKERPATPEEDMTDEVDRDGAMMFIMTTSRLLTELRQTFWTLDYATAARSPPTVQHI